ncbi:MAG: sulfotransferase domain-containing protein [Candidatus Dadabacteria bacterium]|nr:sulfotransferase domain-containing protein [Candidatus Dadabacteria bacterium]
MRCGLYYEQVKAYIEGFPHVKVLLYEDLAQNPGKTLREICEFLSVDYREDVKLERLNKSGVPKFELLNEIINKSSLLKDFLMAVIPMTVRKRMKHKAYMLNMKPVGIPLEQMVSLSILRRGYREPRGAPRKRPLRLAQARARRRFPSVRA